MADSVDILKKLAQQVRNATQEGENTAERVGRVLVGIIENLSQYDIEKLSEYFLRKDQSDGTSFLLKLLGGAEFGNFASGISGANIDAQGAAELLSLVLRGVLTIGEYKKGLKGANIDEQGAADLLSILVRDGMESANFSTGALGAGFCLKKDENGDSYLEVDRMLVRKVATFIQLLIQQIKHVGGQIILTPASMSCVKVEDKGNYYRCYFENTDGEKTIEQEFVVGDLARAQTFNVKEGVNQNVTNTYYWRAVVGVGDNYIDLSKTDCDAGSTEPKAGDDIVQLGNKTDATRQAAIILSAYGNDAPYFKLYRGINSYSLDGKEFVSFSRSEVMIIADTIRFSSGESLKDYIDGAIDDVNSKVDKAISDLSENISFVNQLSKDLESVKNQVDGAIETWFYEPVPTLSNEPAVNWTTNEDKNLHLGDLYYDGNGKAYRFQMSGSSYIWQVITDSDITKALANAKAAQDTADGKRRVFVSTPTNSSAYDVGDLWVNATYGSYNNDLLRCKTAKQANAQFSIGHWELASKYTDDTKANQAQASADAAKQAADSAQQTANNAVQSAATANSLLSDIANDNKLTAQEKQETKKEWDIIVSEKSKNDASADKYGVSKTAYDTAYSALSTYITPLLSSLSTTSDISGTTFRSKFKDYYDARTDMLNAISAKAKSLADAAQQTADKAQQQANQAIEDAANAKVAADNAQSDADEAKSRLDSWASDGSISPTEKQSLKEEIARIDADKTQIANGYTKYSLGTPTAYNNAYTAYRAELVTLTASSPETISIPSDFSTKQSTYYSERTKSLTAVSDAAKDYASELVDNIQIGGTNLVSISNIVDGYISAESGNNYSLKDGYNYCSKDFIPAKYGYYTLTLYNNISVATHSGNIHCYDSNKVWLGMCISSIRWTSPTSITFQTFENTKYIKFTLLKGNEEGNWKLETGTKSTDWSPAPEDVQAEINEAKEDAAEAISNAATAQAKADEAANRLNQWASDGVISPTEKLTLKQEQQKLIAEKDAIIADANKYGVSTTSYVTAFNNYNTELAYHTTSTPENITIRSSFATNQSAYYTAYKAINDAIATAAKKAITDVATDLNGYKSTVESKFEATNNSITAAVTSSKEYTDSAVGEVNSSLTQYKKDVTAQFSVLEGEINSKVSSTEMTTIKKEILDSAATDATNKVNSIQVGGRNLLAISNIEPGFYDQGTGQKGGSGGDSNYRNKELIPVNANYITITLYKSISIVGGNSGNIIAFDSNKTFIRAIKIGITWTSPKSETYQLPENTAYLGVTALNGNVEGNWKLETGTKSTDWTPAPEDVTSDIENAKEDAITTAGSNADKKYATITTVSSMQTSITQLSDSLSLKANKTEVTAVQNNLNQTNNNLSSLTTRVSEAEVALQPDNIWIGISSKVTSTSKINSIVPDSCFDDANYSLLYSGGSRVSAATANNSCPTSYCMKSTQRDVQGKNYVAVTEGEKYYISGYVNAALANYNVRIELSLKKSNGSTKWIVGALVPAKTQGWQKISGYVTIPAEYVKACIWFTIDGQSNFGSAYFTKVYAYKVDESVNQNYALLTSTEKRLTMFNNINNQVWDIYGVDGLKAGDIVTVSFEYEASNLIFNTTSNITAQFSQQYGWSSSPFSLNSNGSGKYISAKPITIGGSSTEPIASVFSLRFDYISANSGGYFRVWNLKVEKGERATPWSAAPSDYSTTEEIKAGISITENTITILGKAISLQGKITFSSLNSSLQSTINGKANSSDVTSSKDDIAKKLGYSSYTDMANKAAAGNTIINGGYIRTSLIDTNTLVAKTLNAANSDGISTLVNKDGMKMTEGSNELFNLTSKKDTVGTTRYYAQMDLTTVYSDGSTLKGTLTPESLFLRGKTKSSDLTLQTILRYNGLMVYDQNGTGLTVNTKGIQLTYCTKLQSGSYSCAVVSYAKCIFSAYITAQGYVSYKIGANIPNSSGTPIEFSVSRTGAGRYKVTHNINDLRYMGQITALSNGNLTVGIFENRNTTSFDYSTISFNGSGWYAQDCGVYLSIYYESPKLFTF